MLLHHRHNTTHPPHGWSVWGERRYMARKGYKKYKAVKVVVDGITFDSKRESERYQELKEMVQNGQIDNLILQPSFELQEGFVNSKGQKVRPIIYKADFSYTDADGKLVVEDVKGMETKDFKLKRKMFDFKYGFDYDFRLVK